MLHRKHFNLLLLPMYWIVIVCLYHKGYTGALVDDGNAGLVDFAIEGWKGILNNYGMTSLYYFHDLVNNIWYEFFGLNTKAWFLLTATLHALNSWLIFINMKTFYQRCNLKHGEKIALFGSLMFLLSPYQSENVIWAATHHYGFALLFFMMMLRLILKLNEQNLFPYSILIAIIYSISLVTREETLVFPGVFAILFFLIKTFNPSTTFSLKKFGGYIIFPNAVFIVLYFVFTKLIKGNWIPHYGTTHIENLSIANYATVFLQYVVKHLGFIHFFDYPIRDAVYSFIAKRTSLSLAIFTTVNLIVLVSLFIKNRKASIVFVGLWVCAIVLFLPVLNLYFMYLFQYENDRMGYFGSIILYQLLPLLLFSMLPVFAYIVCSCFLAISAYFITLSAPKWNGAGEMYFNCVNTLPKNEGRIFFLNVPLKYQSIYVFRTIRRLRDSYQLHYNIYNFERLKPIAWTQFHSENDALRIEKISDNCIRVYLQMTGASWWMWNEMGASDYENDDCIFDVADDHMSYTLTIKNIRSDDSFWITTKSGFYEYKF